MNDSIQSDAPSIFLCYAREDFERVHSLYSLLKQLGLRPWFDKFDLDGGERWQGEIEKAVKNADFFLAAFSKASVTKRGFVQREYKLAMDALAERPPGDVFLIPVRLDDCELPDLFGLGTRLSDLQWVDLFQTGTLTPDDIDSILRTVEAHSNWMRLSPQVLKIINEYCDQLDDQIMETMKVRELPYTDRIIELKALSDKRALQELEERAYKLYLSVDSQEMFGLGLDNYYLIARYLYRAILNDDYVACRHRPFIHSIHQYLSNMIRTARQAERELMIAILIKWFTMKDVYQTSRDFAAFELGMTKSKAAIHVLLRTLDDPFELPLVRYYGAMALGMVGSSDSLDALAEIFTRERDEETRKVIAHAMVHIRRQATR
jgi:TIR domain/HEAT repeats